MRNKFLSIWALATLMVVNISLAQPVQCVLSLSKMDGWQNYDVTITMNDYASKKVLNTFVLTKSAPNKPSVDNLSVPLDCSNLQQVTFNATFSPAIWQNEAGKSYPSSVIVDVASQLAAVPANSNTLTIPVVFPTDFVAVPLPLTEGS